MQQKLKLRKQLETEGQDFLSAKPLFSESTSSDEVVRQALVLNSLNYHFPNPTTTSSQGPHPLALLARGATYE